MHRWLPSLLLLLLIGGAACSSPAPVAAPAAVPPPDAAPAVLPARPPFFLVRGEKEGARMYLLGSIHVGTGEGWGFPPVVREAWRRSDALVVELDPRQVAPDLLRERAVLPPDRNLETVLTRETWNLLAEHLGAVGIPLQPMLQYKPWAVAISLVNLEFERLGYGSSEGVDVSFLERAGSDKPVIPLETAEFQFSMLDGMSEAEQDLMLRDTLLGAREMGSEIQGMIDAWREGNEAELARQFFARLEEHPELAPFYERVFFERNRRMSASLAGLMAGREGETLFAVLGAGHVVGERSIIAMLSSQGYRVERLTHAPSRP